MKMEEYISRMLEVFRLESNREGVGVPIESIELRSHSKPMFYWMQESNSEEMVWYSEIFFNGICVLREGALIASYESAEAAREDSLSVILSRLVVSGLENIKEHTLKARRYGTNCWN